MPQTFDEVESRVFTTFSDEALPVILDRIKAKAAEKNLALPDQLTVTSVLHHRNGKALNAISFNFVKTTGMNPAEALKVKNMTNIIAEIYSNAFCYTNHQSVRHER